MSGRSFLIIFRRELRALFLTPIAYIVIALFLVVIGWFFFSSFFLAGRSDLRDFFSLLPLILAFTVPAITMRLYAEERRSGSYEVLATLPVSSLDVLLGKYASAVAFTLIAVAPTLAYPVFIDALGDLDWGPVVGGYLGALLLALTLCGIGVLASALTRNQIVAFITALAVCAFLTLVDKMLYFFPAGIGKVLQYLGADYHFRSISKGLLDTRDVVYFLSVAFLSVFAAHTVNEQRR